MKHVLTIMEENCLSDMKKLGLLYVPGVILCIACGFYSPLSLFEQTGWITFVPYILCFLGVTIIHYQRIAKLSKDGALTRILLLPLNRYTVLCSEVLFVFASYILVWIMPVIVWLLYALVHQAQINSFTNGFLLFTMTHQFHKNLMPYDAMHALYLLLQLLAISFTVVLTSLMFSVKHHRGLAYILCVAVFSMFYSFGNIIFRNIVYIVIIAICIGVFVKLVGVRRKLS